MFSLDQHRCTDRLITARNHTVFVLLAAGQPLCVEIIEIVGGRHRNPVVPTKVTALAFHAALFMRLARRAELRLKAPVRPEGDKASCLLALIAAQDLLYGGA